MLREHAAELADGEAPGTAVILYGPRGNGKTVLLDWLEREVETSFLGLDTLLLTPSRTPDSEALAAELAPRPWLSTFRPSEVTLPALLATVTWGLDGGPRPSLEALLEARTWHRPLILMFDEAQTLDPAMGRVLLNAAQTTARHLPFLLVLAGTPDLPQRLRSMNASFWSRGRQIRVGRLADSATAAAVRVPLARRGVALGEDLQEGVVWSCRGYPFFTQVLGDAIWRQICEGRDGPPPIVTRPDFAAATRRFRKTRDAYYRTRYDELADERLLPTARAVAAAFATSQGGRIPPELTYDQMDAALADGLRADAESDSVAVARERLDHLGFVWRAGERPAWEPGIPSLMDYVLRHTPAQAA